MSDKKEEKIQEMKDFHKQISYQEEIEGKRKKEDLAQKLRKGEITVYDLDDNEVEEMQDYFEKDIKKQEEELEKIKKHIIEIKKRLEDKNK